MGSSAAACVDVAPYQDVVEEDQRRIGGHKASTPINPPKESDAVPVRTCRRCGLQVPPIDGHHRDLTECVAALRNALAMVTWTQPKDHRPKVKRAAAR